MFVEISEGVYKLINMDEEDDYNEQDLLITRAREYQRDFESVEKVENRRRYLLKSQMKKQIKCQQDYIDDPSDTWTEKNTNCKLCIQYKHREQFPNGLLPRVKHIN